MNTGGTPFSEPAPEVALGQADTRAGACELAAGIVQKLTRTGVRWREIAVACTESGYVQAIKPCCKEPASALITQARPIFSESRFCRR